MTEDNYKELRKRIENLEKEFELLKSNYVLEKVKSQVYSDIIANNTNIKLTKNDKNLNNIFVKSVDEDSYQGRKTYENIKYEEIISSISVKINNLKNGKVYTKQLSEIKQLRMKLFMYVNLEEYIQICNTNIEQIKNVLVHKGFCDKKIKNTTIKTLSSLESRIVKYENYYDECISKDEIDILKKNIDIFTDHPAKYVIFNEQEIFKRFMNYLSCISTIEEIITRCIVNKHGYNNIIYVEKQNDKDPYSFYTLERIKNGKMIWNLDCRLENFSILLRDNLLEYLIWSFRSMYKDIFSDNDYRTDYEKRCQVTECDLQIIIKNIKTLSNTKNIIKLINTIVKNNCVYSEYEKDTFSFNLTSDDPMRINDYSEYDISDIQIRKRIFDDIC